MWIPDFLLTLGLYLIKPPVLMSGYDLLFFWASVCYYQIYDLALFVFFCHLFGSIFCGILLKAFSFFHNGSFLLSLEGQEEFVVFIGMVTEPMCKRAVFC